MAVDAALRRLVRRRAHDRCEYCHCHQSDLPFVTFHVEHVIARQHGGKDVSANLCLACHWCNLNKGPNIATLVDERLVPLFHPRQHDWDEHFSRRGDRIVGRTPIGRGTARLLDMNDEERRELRRLSGT
jgi:hypothetical protein